MQGFMYILHCANGQYYTGSTVKRLNKKITEHALGHGANFTKKHLPVRLVYYEEYPRIEEAFRREKLIRRWSRKKKEDLIKSNTDRLKSLAKKKSG